MTLEQQLNEALGVQQMHPDSDSIWMQQPGNNKDVEVNDEIRNQWERESVSPRLFNTVYSFTPRPGKIIKSNKYLTLYVNRDIGCTPRITYDNVQNINNLIYFNQIVISPSDELRALPDLVTQALKEREAKAIVGAEESLPDNDIFAPEGEGDPLEILIRKCKKDFWTSWNASDLEKAENVFDTWSKEVPVEINTTLKRLGLGPF